MSSLPAGLELTSDWKLQLQQAFTRTFDLLDYLAIPHANAPQALAASNFSCRVTPSFAAKMKKGDPQDPLLLQVLPQSHELMDNIGYAADPVGDLAASPHPGLIHKYQGRALLITTGACAIHCRYCFRREFPYTEHASRHDLNAAYDYLAEDKSLQEIILSGGDPLLLADRQLHEIINRLDAIPHLRTLRIHTRVPSVLPQRINQSLLQLLTTCRLRVVVVTHINHAQEIQNDVPPALQRLYAADIPLFNQTVLLKGVNDQAEDLVRLSEELFEHQVIPYYLHQLDRVRGSAHYEVSENQATLLYDQLRRNLPGYLVPRLVREIAGEPYKTLAL